MSAAQPIKLSSDVAALVMRAGEMSNQAHAVLTAAFEWAETHEKPMTLADYQQRGAAEAHITRTDALRISDDILKTAEQERSDYAEREALGGLRYMA